MNCILQASLPTLPTPSAQIWDMQRGSASGTGLLAAARASGRAATKSGKGGKASRGAAGDSEPRAVVTGMEGLEHLFKEPTVYPSYTAGSVQPMHSGGWGGEMERPTWGEMALGW